MEGGTSDGVGTSAASYQSARTAAAPPQAERVAAVESTFELNGRSGGRGVVTRLRNNQTV